MILGGVLLGLLVLGLAWIAITGLMAKSRLDAVKSQLPQLRAAITSGDVPRAQRLIRQIQNETRSAHGLTSGPAWWVASNIPGLGSPLHTSRVIAAEADRVGTDVLPTASSVASELEHLRIHHGTIDLESLAKLQPQLQTASRAAHSAAEHVANLEPSWLPYVSSARRSLAVELAHVDDDLTGADRTARLLLPMLGEERPQRYFIGFMNEAESRGLGGIPGAYAVATADHGRVVFEHFGSDSDMHGGSGDLNLGTDFAARYSQNEPTQVFQNSDLSPDFSYAAQIWAAMWTKKTGQRIDGAIAVDPTALSYLLKVTGPARLSGGRELTWQNVVALTQKTQYELFDGTSGRDKAERKQFLTEVAKASADRLIRGGDPVHLVKALSRAATERRLVVWSARPDLEEEIKLADWAGELGNSFGIPLTGFVVNNAAASKLDYYLERTMTYQRTDCDSGGTATATLRVTNTAPRSGLPRYVTIRADNPPKSAKPGDNKLIVTYYANAAARIMSVTVDGRPVTVASLPEGNSLAATVTIELPAETSRTIKVTIAEPASYGDLQVLRQPLVRPLRTKVDSPC